MEAALIPDPDPTATRVAISRGAPAPSPEAVRQLTAALYAVAGAIDAGVPPRVGELPGDEALSRSPTPCARCCLRSGRCQRSRLLPADLDLREITRVGDADSPSRA